MSVPRSLFLLLVVTAISAACARAQATDDKAPAKTPAKREVDMSDIPPDSAAEQKEMAELGPNFKLFRTQHFSVLHNVNDAQVKAFAAAIEKTYRSNVNYTMTLDIVPKKPPKKLIIYYFSQHEDYDNYSRKVGQGPRPQSQPGVFFPNLNRSMFYDFRNQDSLKKVREDADKKVEDLKKQLSGKVTPEKRREINKQISDAKAQSNRSGVVGGGFTESIVQHEVTHHVLWNVGLHNPKSFFANPRWFAEGIAMMFETVGTGKSSNIGAVNRQRLDEYRALEASGHLFDVKQFISSPAPFASPETIGQAYAQAWALAHYLNRTKRSAIKGFVERINKRPASYESKPEEEIKEFEKAFGKIDDEWVKKWKTWMKNVR
ncbi:MAG TPA: DUF1570 domain-containing protein [Phycisphaerae bacterium]|nr:DUF1570 domain-containing protein [Phycisphaerae bacterium]